MARSALRKPALRDARRRRRGAVFASVHSLLVLATLAYIHHGWVHVSSEYAETWGLFLILDFPASLVAIVWAEIVGFGTPT